MANTFTGTITWLGEEKKGTSSRGAWVSQEVEITDTTSGSQYPDKAIFQFIGENLDKFKNMLVLNAMVTVSYDFQVRDWQNRKFLTLRGWKVEPAMQQTVQPQAYMQQPVVTQPYAQPMPAQGYVQQPQPQPQPMGQQPVQYPFPPPSNY